MTGFVVQGHILLTIQICLTTFKENKNYKFVPDYF